MPDGRTRSLQQIRERAATPCAKTSLGQKGRRRPRPNDGVVSFWWLGARLSTLCLIIAAVVPGVASSAQPAPLRFDLQISRSTLRQGQTIRLAVRAPAAPRSLKVTFAGRTWPVYRTGPSAWQTFLGTDPTTKPGRYALTVEAVGPSGTIARIRRDVTVLRVAFPKRRLTFDPETSKLLTPEAVARERQRVREALREAHPTQLWEDPFALPIDGPISSPYGVLSVYMGTTRGFHSGVDFAVPEGTAVRAAGAGIVRLAELLPLSGNAVMIDHGVGVITSYLHMSAIETHVGQQVRKGDVIGRVGSTGLATGPHLHWGLRVNAIRVDPMPWAVR